MTDTRTRRAELTENSSEMLWGQYKNGYQVILRFFSLEWAPHSGVLRRCGTEFLEPGSAAFRHDFLRLCVEKR